MVTGGVYVARRTWSWDEKRRIVDEAFSGDASVSAVVRRHGLQNHQIYHWRDGLAAERVNAAAADFVAVTVMPKIDVPLLPARSRSDADKTAKTRNRASRVVICDYVEIALPGGTTIKAPMSAGAAFVAELVKGLSRGSS